MERQLHIDTKFYPVLGKIFTPIVLDALIEDGYSRYFYEVIKTSGLLSQISNTLRLKKFYDSIYDILSKKYRNEYIYKNEIVNKILLGRHSLNTARILTEFRIAQCKSDVVILNGTSNAYEIKTIYDTYERLVKQIDCYRNVFDYVNVVTSDEQTERIIEIVPNTVGVLVLTKRGNLSVRREPTSNKQYIDPSIVFDSLRKNEYTAIVRKYFNCVPNVPNTRYYQECKNLFKSIEPSIVHDEMVKQLHSRKDVLAIKDILGEIPLSLRAYVMRFGIGKTELLKLIDLLDSNAKDVLMASR